VRVHGNDRVRLEDVRSAPRGNVKWRERDDCSWRNRAAAGERGQAASVCVWDAGRGCEALAEGR
jgi:hypothetical protein